MSVKTIVINLNNIDPDCLGSLCVQLKKISCMYKRDPINNVMIITAQPQNLARVKKVVALYV